MQTEQQLTFADFRLDLVREQLSRGQEEIPLPGQVFALLRYLVEHPGQLVSKAELFAALWPGTAVTDGALTFCLVELRKALRDNAKAPRFIETVHRRGYRFIAPFSIAQPGVSSQHSVASNPPLLTQSSAPSPQHSLLVGRETELEQLHQWFHRTLNGERQIVFVTGEAGIGKTTLIDAFLQSLESSVKAGLKVKVRNSKSDPASSLHSLVPRLWVARGQCIEQYGSGEPYMPILEALGRLCRDPGGEQLVPLLYRHAPTWLVQLPAVLPAAELEVLQRQIQGVTRERMLREMGDALDTLTAERSLVLWLEDLHWSDVSTLELLALLARRREPARLLVLGAYRPVDVIVRDHPLRTVKQELQLHGLCQELPLALLSEATIGEYLTRRFHGKATGEPRLQPLAKAIYRRTDGNPLFMVTTVEDLITQQVLMKDGERWVVQEELAAIDARVPDTLQQLIEGQIERLNAEDRQILESASVAGVEFSAAAVAAGIAVAAAAVEERCTGLARQGRFLRARSIENWPDGTVAAGYRFLHALYQEVLYQRLSAGRRRRLHQQIGERKERGYGERAREIASELAVHFEQGRDYRKAVQYLQYAGENAMRRSAHQEAIQLFTKSLEVLKALPDTPERIQQELTLHLALNGALIFAKGFTAPEAEKAAIRARDLCQQLGKPPQLFPAVLGSLYMLYQNRGELQAAREVAEQMLRLAQSVQNQHLLSVAHLALGGTLYWLGEFASARTHQEQAIALYNPPQHTRDTLVVNPRVQGPYYASVTLWHLGYPDQARKESQEAVALAVQLSHPFLLAQTLGFAAQFHSFSQEWRLARERAEAVITLSTDQGFPFWLAQGNVIRGGVLAEQGKVEEGIAQMLQGLAAFRTMGAELVRISHLPRLAAAYAKAG